MRLYEFDGRGDPLTIRLVAVVNQLKNDIDNGDIVPDWTVDEFLSYLEDNGVDLAKSDLIDMVQNPPLSKVISNIQGDEVIFKGYSDVDDSEETDKTADQKKDVVKNMSKRAMK